MCGYEESGLNSNILLFRRKNGNKEQEEWLLGKVLYLYIWTECTTSLTHPLESTVEVD